MAQARGMGRDAGPDTLTVCLPGTALGSVPGGSITRGIPSTRAPPESPGTYRGSITHVGTWPCRQWAGLALSHAVPGMAQTLVTEQGDFGGNSCSGVH